MVAKFWRADSKRCSSSKSQRNSYDHYGDIKHSRSVEADGKVPIDILRREIKWEFAIPGNICWLEGSTHVINAGFI